MPLTFPLSLAAFQDRFGYAVSFFDIAANQNSLTLGSGESLSSSTAGEMWRGTLTLPPANAPDAEAAAVMLRAIELMQGTFLLSPPHMDYTGLAQGQIEGSTQADRIAFRGLAQGRVVPAGQYFSFQFGGKYGLHQVVEAVTANASGVTPEASIVPPLEPNWAVGAIVQFARPVLKARLETGQRIGPTATPAVMAGQQFAWTQTFR